MVDKIIVFVEQRGKVLVYFEEISGDYEITRCICQDDLIGIKDTKHAIYTVKNKKTNKQGCAHILFGDESYQNVLSIINNLIIIMNDTDGT